MIKQVSLFGEQESPKPSVKMEADLVLNPAPHPGHVLTVRGTNGSGKSFVARRLMEEAQPLEKIYREGRKNPIFYIGKNAVNHCIAFVGSYENDCGGCDSIDEVSKVYEIVRKLSDAGYVVFYEGLLHAADAKWALSLDRPISIIYLDTPLETCIDSINERRKAKGITEGVNPSNPTAKYKSVQSSLNRIKAGEVPKAALFHVGREEAFQVARKLMAL